MATHDAAMTQFGQWWKRSMRAGYAFAQGADLHGNLPERHFVWESRRALLWGFGVPIASLVAAVLWSPIAWLAMLAYPLQVLRLIISRAGRLSDRVSIAFFQVIARFPES